MLIKHEFETKDQWLNARKGVLTGTTIGKYIGITSPFKPKTPEQMDKDPAVIFGRNCEESVLTIFKNLPEIAKQTLVQPTIKPTLWVRSDEPRLAGSFDALAWEGNDEGFCECKTTSAGLYDLKNDIVPDTTWLQIIHYFSLNDNFKFCYLVVLSYPKWGNETVKLDYKKILRKDVEDRIINLRGWQEYLLNKI